MVQSACPSPRGKREASRPVRPPELGLVAAKDRAVAADGPADVDAAAGTPCVESSQTGAAEEEADAAAEETIVVEDAAGTPCVESSQTAAAAICVDEGTAAADEGKATKAGFCTAQALFFLRTFRMLPLLALLSSRLKPADPWIVSGL